MIKKGVLITIVFVISLLIQLLSQVVVTRIFGASFSLDIFLAAVTIPTILVTSIYATLNDIFLPIYNDWRKDDPKNADNLLFSSLVVLVILATLVVIASGFFLEYISLLFFGSRGVTFVVESSQQMYVMLYSVPASIAATLLGTYFYAKKQLLRFPIAQSIGSISNLLLIILLQPVIGIWALPWAFLLNIVIQTLFVLPKTLFHFEFIKIPFVRIILIWLPFIVGSFAIRSDSLIIRSFGSSLPSGYLVYLNLVSKIFSLATGVMTVGIQVTVLPHLVESISSNQHKKAFAMVRNAKLLAWGISILVTITTVVLGPYVVKILFVGGKFKTFDAFLAVKLLPYFIIPAIGWGIINVYFQPLIAIKKIIQLSLLQISCVIFAWITGLLVNYFFGTMLAITSGLTVLLFTGIIGSEILWQIYKRKLRSA